jgi:4-amino-4-deoxy-L-arabinose transferase-like glycosyltransferase
MPALPPHLIPPETPAGEDAVARPSRSWWSTVGPWYLCWFAVGFGLVLRLARYLANPSVWHDEAALIVNVLQRNFQQLLGNLSFSEGAPPGFLWLERALAITLGDSTYLLRLVPMLAGCLSLLLFAWLAWRLLPRSASPWAVLIFACSDRLLWHAAEAKPYALDVFLAVGVLALFVILQHRSLVFQLILFTLLSPLLIWLSYPGSFLCGALLIALLPAVWQRGKGWHLGLYGVWAAVVGVSFLALLLGPIQAQRRPETVAHFTGLFPDYGQPWGIPLWLVQQTLGVFHYACNPNGGWLAFLAIPGVLYFWREQDRRLLILLVLPLGLALVASFLHCYPYGRVRLMAYTAPALILLLAAGIPATLRCLVSLSDRESFPFRFRLRMFRLVSTAGLLVLLALPLCNTLYRVVVPWQRADAAGAVAYVQAHSRPEDAVTFNHWEYRYYFRNEPGSIKPIEEGGLLFPQRLWVVLTTATMAERQELVGEITRHRPALLRQDFAHTTVLLLQPMPEYQIALDAGLGVARRNEIP